MLAKATRVPRTVLDLRFGVDVLEQTLMVVARAEPGEEMTLGHFHRIIPGAMMAE